MPGSSGVEDSNPGMSPWPGAEVTSEKLVRTLSSKLVTMPPRKLVTMPPRKLVTKPRQETSHTAPQGLLRKNV